LLSLQNHRRSEDFLRKEAMSSWLELLFTVLAFAGFILIATYYPPAKNGDLLH